MKFEITNGLIARAGNVARMLTAHDEKYLPARIKSMAALVESPIELLMFSALLDVVRWQEGYPEFIGDERGLLYKVLERSERSSFVIVPQARIDDYRVDFLIARRAGPFSWKLAIECDGHEFHERTKEQAARDKSRDRAILAHGVPIMRFTGKEIWADATACAEEVVAHFNSSLGDFESHRYEQSIAAGAASSPRSRDMAGEQG